MIQFLNIRNFVDEINICLLLKAQTVLTGNIFNTKRNLEVNDWH